ncbi:MarR family transcriptional regulator [Modestobacter sp. VKM Ac-2983]|uniref:MarR family winged helix-turn-helix transcriptional regulator n=1 Tax=Modestobacter sp. VKM Ac-2983 TaxID=3004137 RepID=UPI0022AB9D59|nr:MarR family transcriptional regulator [Modestobacter sp. VKM Ac-2983]MCZ2807070.1 MarR family transcriptional regulator [Modestobacter sp. VKM Ac-2983]
MSDLLDGSRPTRDGDTGTGDAMDVILAQWAQQRPDLDCSPMGVIGRISQLQREVFLAQRATFARHGLDAPSFDVLAALRRAGEPYQLTPTALMRTALVTSGAITQRLDRLEEKGLITRGRSEADGRAVVVTLTDAGRTALDAALPDHLDTEHGMLAALSPEERTQLAGLLRRWLITLGRVPGGSPDPS